jgi:hypothetical protein
VKWNIWRSVLAGALIGVVEAAGLAAVRPAPRAPLGVVRRADRLRKPSLARLGVWFLDPLTRVRPDPSDLRRPVPGGRLSVLIPARWSVGRDPGSRQDFPGREV